MKIGATASITLFFVSALHAQMTCERTDLPVPLRAQSLAELLPDVVIRCTGGLPTTPGSPIPQFQVLVSANTAFTSRVLQPVAGQSWNWTDALLLMDEPPPDQQAVCVQASPSSSCAAIAGSAPASNVFQGELLQSNVISFQGVPIDAPGPVQRIIRITNLRVDMNQLPLTPAPPGPLLSVQIFSSDGIAITLNNASQASGVAQPGLIFSARTAADNPAPSLLPPSRSRRRCCPQ